MITHLLFFVLVLLLIGLAPADGTELPSSFYEFALSILLSYAVLLGMLFLQNRTFKKGLYLVSQMEIVLFFFAYYFIFNAGAALPFFIPIFKSQFLSALLPICLYLFATAFYYLTSSKPFKLTPALRQIKVLIPFGLPFLIFTAITDIAIFLGLSPFENVWIGLGSLILVALFLATGFPPLICKLWECAPLQDIEIKKRLERICQRAKFAHAGLKTWNLLEFAPTAAILGIFAPSRYILFTPSLLKHLHPNAIEAVLAHEIGHSKHRHLLFFPFILAGMVFFISILLEGFLFLFPNLSHPAIIFILTAIFIALYFRLVIGFFSRLFERQADLYGMQIGVPIPSMIEALDTIGNLTGNSHKLPNWHHFSIEERIQFLKKVEQNPDLARQHHKYIWNMQMLFLFCLGLAALLFFAF